MLVITISGVTKKFELGNLFTTPGVLDLITTGEVSLETINSCLTRYVLGDWGDMSEDDKIANDQALTTGDRIFSSYKVSDFQKVWIITEYDRSCTTILLPSEY